MIIDGHRHILGGHEDILRNMDALGIDKTVLVGVGVRDLGVITIRDSLIFRSDFLMRFFGSLKARLLVNSPALKRVLLENPVNDRVLDAVKAVPDRFLGFAFINPDSKDALDELRRCLDTGMRGVKLALVQFSTDLSGPSMAAICETARDRGVPIFVHQGITGPSSDLRQVTATFPEVDFIIAHGGAQYYDQAMELATSRSNIHIDTSSYLVPFSKLARICKSIGAGKLIFGSDVPVMSRDPSEGLDRVRRLPVSEDDRARILGGNLADLLELQ